MTRQNDATSEGLEHALGADVEVDADIGDAAAAGCVPDDHDARPRPGIFGFDDHDRHSASDPDLGWNLPA